MKYMRGDCVEEGSMEEPIGSYLHTYCKDIEPIYRSWSPPPSLSTPLSEDIGADTYAVEH